MPGLLVANRGEIAVRILRTAADLGLHTVAVHSADDADALHVKLADTAVRLDGVGPAPYLDIDRLVRIAVDQGCDTVHPGYGFLSENADFARACAAAGLVFVGPSPDVLSLLGDKSRARALAVDLGIPVLAGTGPVNGDEAEAFFAEHGPVMVKAVAGGGGKGMREVHDLADLPAALERCRAEAEAAFGDGEVYLERLLAHARHIEVQIVGTTALGDRDCSLQRDHQKVVEIAPAPRLDPDLRKALHDAATRVAEAVAYQGVGTVEFLVSPDGDFVFLEANPRLQVEHTVTEEVTGIDLVRTQLRIAAGDTPDLTHRERGCAVQLRITLASAGTITAFQPATGPGVRVDTHAYGGYRTGDRFDALLAKLVVHADDLDTALRKARRALTEFRVDGVPTNLPFLRTLLDRDLSDTHTGFLNDLPTPQHGPRSPVTGTVVAIEPGTVVVEAMKMQHAIPTGNGKVLVAVGDTVTEGAPVADGGDLVETEEPTPIDLDTIRPDLAEVLARHDFHRPDADEKRRRTGHRTARENVTDLCDPDSFVEYGGLAIAAQRRRRSLEELVDRTPADGLVAGIGTIDGTRAAVMSYDYTVLAGTQGLRNHAKLDRVLALAEQRHLPVVLFAEGGGGRPGDTDHGMVSGLDTGSFHAMAKLSGAVPLIGIVSGRCFAGNAVLLGTCDVIIATADANIGMGGPAMVEGGGLGVFSPEDIGPMDVQVPNGVVDIAVTDEAEAVTVAKKYLSYFTGPRSPWTAPDQRLLRHAIPENRLRAYDVRTVVTTLADTDSVLELRQSFGRGILTALIRVEGKPIGLIANDPAHLGGAIDSDAADKAARFLQLCDAFDLPVLSLCDTPGFMVGPDAERTATVRHLTRMMVVAANIDVPFGLVVLRKAYGLGAQAMAGGSLAVPRFTISWPSGEFGPMGLEGAVRLGFRRELEAIADPEERQATFNTMVAASYDHGKALNLATAFEVDDVIDPAETRRWITTNFDDQTKPPRTTGKKRPFIDTW